MMVFVVQVEKGGEDAYCICTQGLGSIGVADGVSGWAEEGIDPADYSRTLMEWVVVAGMHYVLTADVHARGVACIALQPHSWHARVGAQSPLFWET